MTLEASGRYLFLPSLGRQPRLSAPCVASEVREVRGESCCDMRASLAPSVLALLRRLWTSQYINPASARQAFAAHAAENSLGCCSALHSNVLAALLMQPWKLYIQY